MGRLCFIAYEKDFLCSGSHTKRTFSTSQDSNHSFSSLVESWLRYCNTVWGNCGFTLKNKLESLQNLAGRVVTRTKYGCAEPDQLLKNLRGLNVHQQIDFVTTVMVHKSISNFTPYLKSLFTKSRSIHNHYTRFANLNLFPIHAKLKFRQRCSSNSMH